MNLYLFVKRIFSLIFPKKTHEELCFFNKGGAAETVFAGNKKNENLDIYYYC